MAADALDPALIRRFADDLTAALGRAVAPGETLAMAVSGGPDSMAMLALAVGAWPGQVIAATVDHGFRPESAVEAMAVARCCQALGVPHTTLTPDTPIARSNLHANARQARYALLERWAVAAGATLLATAHHADDQAETFLMRAARGSGVAGLAGVRALQRRDVVVPVPHAPHAPTDELPDAPPDASGVAFVANAWSLSIVRPLLGWRRAELRTVATMLHLPFVDDPSNADDRFDRSRFRALLAAAPDLDPVNLARAAAHAAEADDAIREMEAWLWRERRRLPTGENPDEEIWLDLEGLPRELKRRLSRQAIGHVRMICGIVRPDFSDATNIEPLLDSLETGKSATQSGILVRPSATIWRFSEAPARRKH